MAQRRNAHGRQFLAVSVYPSMLAGPRLRAEQYAPYLGAAGIHFAAWSLIPARLCRRYFSSPPIVKVAIACISLARLALLAVRVRQADAVLVLREALPFGPPILEWAMAQVRPLIWDVDDAVWEPFEGLHLGRLPDWVRKTGDKYSRICKVATEVWAGSVHTANWCRQRNVNVYVVPTVVAVSDRPPEIKRGRTVGWIGSASTIVFLEDVLPALGCVTPPVDLVVVGGKPRWAHGLNIESRPWSADSEARALDTIVVGLYPIRRGHPLAEGKSGYKAVLYMAHGIAQVAAPVGANAGLVRDGIDGFHASTQEEWTRAVQHLLDDEALRTRMALAAWRRAREQYSLQAWGPRIASRVEAVIAGKADRGAPRT